MRMILWRRNMLRLGGMGLTRLKFFQIPHLLLPKEMCKIVFRLLPITFTHTLPQSTPHAVSERFVGRVAPPFIQFVALSYC